MAPQFVVAPEAQDKEHLDFETLIADTSAWLIESSLGDLDGVIEATLDHIRKSFRADRCALLRVSEDQQVVNVAYASYAEGVSRVSGDVNLAEHYPWCARRLLVEHEPVIVSRMADLPAEAALDRASWVQLGTLSNLTIPILVGSAVRELIVIHTVFEERDWSHRYVPRLRLLGEALVNALERQQAFDSLRVSEARLERAAASGGSGCWELDTTTGQVWLTNVARRLYGLTPDEPVTYDRFISRIHPDDRNEVVAHLKAAISTDSRFDEQYRIVLDDGSVRWIHGTGRADGPTRLLGVSVDVTDRVEADREAREQSARVAAAVDVAELGFLEWRVGCGQPFLDTRMRDLLGIGIEVSQDIYELWFSRVHEHDRKALLEQRGRLLAGHFDRFAIEYRYDHPRRGWIWLRHTTRRLEDDRHGGAAYLITAILDITECRRREEDLRAALEEVSRLRQQCQRENIYLRQESRGRLGAELVIGRSPVIRRAVDLAEEVAGTNSTVLLIGETGTGKERFATLIHEASPRRARTIIRVNCSAIPDALIESELFGREKGAYTGALSKQVGRFELASGSTLFLDEISDLPLEMQVKLLRVLQERTIERLGSPRPLPVDVRIIAATNRDLEQAVTDGKFRSDLYYRVNVFPITIPPLRERLEDIPLLVEAFVDELSATMGKRVDAVERASLDALQRYRWPGNVRELRNVVERAMIRTTSRTLHIELPVPATLPSAAASGAPPPGAVLEEVEREHIVRVLHDTGWRIRGKGAAAEVLGLKPTTLESRMAKLGIQRPAPQGT
jgi:transcriptional regulator with GAF, ATPase, and Fis domain